MLQDFLAGRPSTSTQSNLPEANPGSDFRPLLTASVLAEARPKSDVTQTAQTTPREEPEVELIEGNGKVQRIIITCTCCQRIELECHY
jgi:hypothetical protein